MVKVLIWGRREQYDSYINQIKYEELKGNIEVIGVVSDECYLDKFDGYPVIKKQDVRNYDVDCVVVCSVKFHYQPTVQEIKTILPDVAIVKINIFNIPLFDMKRYMEIFNKKVSVISNSCWGGLTYSALYMPFFSPFINLTIAPDDYIRLLKNFKYYMSIPLKFIKDRDINGNPIGALDDVHIDFTHYVNFKEAEFCWNKRLKRMNYDNLFIYMAIPNVEIAKEFEALNIGSKYGFCSFDYTAEGIYSIKSYTQSEEVIRTMGHRRFSSYMNDQARRRLYDYDDELGNRGAKTIKIYDSLKLLNGEKDFLRERYSDEKFTG